MRINKEAVEALKPIFRAELKRIRESIEGDLFEYMLITTRVISHPHPEDYKPWSNVPAKIRTASARLETWSNLFSSIIDESEAHLFTDEAIETLLYPSE